jgi:hypothetical protein
MARMWPLLLSSHLNWVNLVFQKLILTCMFHVTQAFLIWMQGVIASASKSLNQGGTEVVLVENQPLGDDVIYYVGVKSEDHQGAQYAMVGLSQEEPFDFTDENGNRVFRGIPLNQGIIPDGTPGSPGAGLGLLLVIR